MEPPTVFSQQLDNLLIFFKRPMRQLLKKPTSISCDGIGILNMAHEKKIVGVPIESGDFVLVGKLLVHQRVS